MSAPEYENLTDAELAMKVYLAIIEHDDALPDGVMELFRPAWKMAAALAGRLRGPYCSEEGCGQPHLASFPWCAWHRPASYGPLPDGFPPYPGPSR